MSATGAFATIILERLLDIVTVLVLLASFVFVFGRDLAAANPAGFRGGQVGRRDAPARRRSSRWSSCSCSPAIRRGSAARWRGSSRSLPSTLAGLLARVAEKFARGLGAIRRPGRLLVALALVVSAVAVHRARHLVGGHGVSSRRCRSPDRFC